MLPNRNAAITRSRIEPSFASRDPHRRARQETYGEFIHACDEETSPSRHVASMVQILLKRSDRPLLRVGRGSRASKLDCDRPHFLDAEGMIGDALCSGRHDVRSKSQSSTMRDAGRSESDTFNSLLGRSEERGVERSGRWNSAPLHCANAFVLFRQSVKRMAAYCRRSKSETQEIGPL
jgi:hypothetical protein